MTYEFTRTELLIGKEALEKLKNSKVAIFGIGGVGSFVAEGLARSGVGRLILIDRDDVSITNINRQIHATHKTIGRPKAEVMKERISDINPEAEVSAIQRFYLPDCSEDFLTGDEDYIVDAMDTVTAKIDLIVRAGEMGIPIISSMGTGNKLDPTKFEVADIYETSVCPLAKVMRRELRRRGVEKLKVVYSRELPVCLTEIEDKSCDINCSDLGITEELPPGKHRIPGSISFVPPVAGLIIAGEVIKDLTKYSQK